MCRMHVAGTHGEWDRGSTAGGSVDGVRARLAVAADAHARHTYTRVACGWMACAREHSRTRALAHVRTRMRRPWHTFQQVLRRCQKPPLAEKQVAGQLPSVAREKTGLWGSGHAQAPFTRTGSTVG
eukprot:170419-Chlamydomonas_euryale.AAC.1